MAAADRGPTAAPPPVQKPPRPALQDDQEDQRLEQTEAADGLTAGHGSHAGGRMMRSRPADGSMERYAAAAAAKEGVTMDGQPAGEGGRDGRRQRETRRTARARRGQRGRWRPPPAAGSATGRVDGRRQQRRRADGGAALDPRRADLRRPDPRRAATAAAGGRQRPPPAARSATGGWLDGRRAGSGPRRAAGEGADGEGRDGRRQGPASAAADFPSRGADRRGRRGVDGCTG